MDYISRADQNALNARYKFTAFIVVVFGVTVVTYVLIGRIVTLTSARRPPNPLREGFYYTALVVGLGKVVLRRVLLSRAQVGKLVLRGARRTRWYTQYGRHHHDRRHRFYLGGGRCQPGARCLQLPAPFRVGTAGCRRLTTNWGGTDGPRNGESLVISSPSLPEEFRCLSAIAEQS